MADRVAKETLQAAFDNDTISQLQRRSPPHMHCEIQVIDAYQGTTTISSHLQKSIKTHCSSATLKNHWVNRFQLRDHTSHIDWALKKKSHANTTKSMNRWLSKHTAGFCGVGKVLVRYKYQTHANCPRCGLTPETTTHVLTCQDDSACKLWDDNVSQLEKWMETQGVFSEIAHHISQNLRSWKYGLRLQQHLPTNQFLREAIQQQDRIGWKEFIYGFWSKKMVSMSATIPTSLILQQILHSSSVKSSTQNLENCLGDVDA